MVAIARSGGGDDGTGHDGQGAGSSAGSGPGVSPAKRVALPDIAAVRNASPQPDWASYSGPVPILRYHAVGAARLTDTLPELFVPPADFEAQMDWLEDHGYEAVGLETVQAAWAGGGILPRKPIVLSFDGVGSDLLADVVPDLSRRGWPGVLVLDAEAPLPRPAAVARLIALGWDIEPSGRDPAAARREILSRFPAPARDFAFPSADSAGPSTAVVRSAGFAGATGATGGGFAEADRPYAMPRITIFRPSRIEGFVEAIRSRGGGVGA